MSASGGTLSAQQRVERDRRIAEARAAGEQWDVIAQREGVSRATAKRAVKAHGDMVVGPLGLEQVDGDDVLLRVIRSHLAMLGVAERLAVADRVNDNAKIGALRVASTLGTNTLQILAAVGLLRGHSGLERYQAELEDAAKVVVNLADRHGIGIEEVDAALAAMRVPSHIVAGEVA